MQNKGIRLMAAILVVAALSGCGKSDAEPTQQAAKATNVTVYSVQPDSIENTVSYTGEIKAAEQVSVSPKISGKAVKVNVKEGDWVNAGDVLIELDSTDLQLTYNQAMAAYNSAKASYSMMTNSTTKQAENQTSQALAAAQQEYKDAQEAYEKEKKLYDQNSSVKVAQNSYNDAAAAYQREEELQQQNSSVKLAQTTYDNAVAAYEREKQLNENDSTVKIAENSYNDAVEAYNRAKNLYDNDTSLVAARNALKEAEDNLARTRELFEMGAATQVMLDSANSAVENARANVQNLEASKQASLDSASSAMISAEENLKTVRANKNAALDAAHASMLSAEENLKTAKTTAGASLDAAYSAMVSAEENLKTTKINASTALDNAQSRLNKAQTSLQSAKENKDLTFNVSSKENAATAAASVDSAKASLDIAKNNLDNTKIKAPIAGYVATKKADVGQMVAQGTEVVKLQNANAVDAEINVTESVINSITVGTPATVSVKSAGAEEIKGTVSLVNQTKNEQTGLYTVRVTIPNDNKVLKIGMFADITLTTVALNDVMTVPSEAILQLEEEKYVYVAKGTTAQKTNVVTGVNDEDKTEIVAGLSAGDQIVVKGKEYLSEKNNQIAIVD